MANSTSISEFKERVVDAIAHDNDFFVAFDADGCENGGDLIDTHIFKYNKVPETIMTVSTYLTVLVHTKTKDLQKAFITPTLEFYIYCNCNHMKMDRQITKDNRCDYLSMLLDQKFNGTTEYGGIGQLTLILNTEGSYNKDFLYRHLVFETIDLNDSICESW